MGRQDKPKTEMIMGRNDSTKPHERVYKDVPYTRQQIIDIFKGYDKNGDGKLSWDEVKAAFAKLGALLPDYRAWRGRRCADADKDGFISLKTELNELVTYTLELGYAPRSN